MATLHRKNFDTPDETRSFPNGKLEVMRIGGLSMARSEFQPGWHWAEDIRPLVGGESCQVHHVGHLLSGRLGVRLDDGTEIELGPGDVYDIPPGHDGWVIGDEPVVGLEISGAEEFAKPR